MGDSEKATLNAIRDAAMREFLDKGFQAASLRSIVKEAGVTTGAFYGYYDSKEKLFEALVSDTADTIFSRFCGQLDSFLTISLDDQQRRMGEFSKSYMLEMLAFADAHRDSIRLILQCSTGTIYEHFVHQMVELEIRNTDQFIDRLRQQGIRVQSPAPYLTHIIVSGMFSAFFELIVHDVPQEERRACVCQLADFHTAGWRKLLGL